MRVCIFCKTRYQKGSGITFHKFPTDDTKEIWLKNMNKKNWNPKPSYHLCSKHFSDDCFNKHLSRTNLKDGSVPTIFSENLPSMNIKISTQSSKLIIEPFARNEQTCHEVQKQITNEIGNTSRSDKRDSVTNDHIYESKSIVTTFDINKKIKHDHQYFNTYNSLQRNIERYRNALKSTQSQVKVLTKHVNRLKNSVTRLKGVIKVLKSKVKSSNSS